MQDNTDMNTKNDNYTPRERVDAQLLQKLLQENDGFADRAVQTGTRVPCGDAHRQTNCTPERVRPSSPNVSRPCGLNSGWPLAMVYSPAQPFEELYDAEEGLIRGTIFRQLDFPLTVGRCQEGRWKV